MKRFVVLVAALLLTATACGGDEETANDDAPLSGNDAKAAASIEQYWLDNDVDAKAAACLGDRMVREFGVAHLQDLELIDDKFEAIETSKTVFSSSTDAPKAAELIVDCRGMTTLMRQLYEGIDDTAAQCLADAFGRDRMVAAMTASLQQTTAPDTPQDVTIEMSKCVANK